MEAPVPVKRPGLFLAVDAPKGLLQPGNLDLRTRPQVKNPDGSVSTVRSMSVNFGKGEVLFPTVAEDGSRVLSDKEAIQQYLKTGKHLGVFDTPENATRYAEQLHLQQEKMYSDKQQQGYIKDILGFK